MQADSVSGLRNDTNTSAERMRPCCGSRQLLVGKVRMQLSRGWLHGAMYSFVESWSLPDICDDIRSSLALRLHLYQHRQILLVSASVTERSLTSQEILLRIRLVAQLVT